MGYYPHANKEFSDLAHYIHSGKLVMNLIADSRTLDEYAFALGSLAHYAGDATGHVVAVNVVEPMLYKKVGRKFGPTATYEDAPTEHLKTEFSFDVIQVARGFYAPQAYHDFIGFYVARDLLDRAFAHTYCLHLSDVTPDVDRAINSYRRTVSGLIPKATRVAWAIHRRSIERRTPGVVPSKFIYNISRAAYEREWGPDYDRPSFKDRLLAFLLRILPRVGPLRELEFRTPSASEEDLFIKSFDDTLDRYTKLLDLAKEGEVSLPDINLDTGDPSRPGTYRLADDAVSKLQNDLRRKGMSCPGISSAVVPR